MVESLREALLNPETAVHREFEQNRRNGYQDDRALSIDWRNFRSGCVWEPVPISRGS